MRPVTIAITTPISPTAPTAIATVCAPRTRNESDIPRKNVTISTAMHAQDAADARILRPWGQCASMEQSVVDAAPRPGVFVPGWTRGCSGHGHRNIDLPDRDRRDPLLRRQRGRLGARDLHGRPDPDDLRSPRVGDLAVPRRLAAPQAGR